jgi:hypothetical protein
MAIWPTTSRSVMNTRGLFPLVRAGVPHPSNGHSVRRPSMLRLKRSRMYEHTKTQTIAFRGGWHAPGSLAH